MTFRVIVDDKAIDDIERNALWWAENHSPAEALRWYELAFKKIHSLDELPTRHALSRENDDFGQRVNAVLEETVAELRTAAETAQEKKQRPATGQRGLF